MDQLNELFVNDEQKKLSKVVENWTKKLKKILEKHKKVDKIHEKVIKTIKIYSTCEKILKIAFIIIKYFQKCI